MADLYRIDVTSTTVLGFDKPMKGWLWTYAGPASKQPGSLFGKLNTNNGPVVFPKVVTALRGLGLASAKRALPVPRPGGPYEWPYLELLHQAFPDEVPAPDAPVNLVLDVRSIHPDARLPATSDPCDFHLFAIRLLGLVTGGLDNPIYRQFGDKLREDVYGRDVYGSIIWSASLGKRELLPAHPDRPGSFYRAPFEIIAPRSMVTHIKAGDHYNSTGWW